VTRARAEAVDGAQTVVRVTTARIPTVSRARFGAGRASGCADGAAARPAS
jgi:hypothetical protein